ncbi:hypothetical protein LTS18_008960, partial [Coniosporium uncinatum]
MAVDTRSKTVDRTRLFRHRRNKTKTQRPAEWIMTLRGMLFFPDGKESIEILDHCTLNIHGLLYQELDGLRDAAIALKLGRLSLPCDDIQTSIDRIKRYRQAYSSRRSHNPSTSNVSLADVMEEMEKPGSREEDIVRTVSDSKEFISSILRGIQEFQFAISSFGLTMQLRDMPSENSVYFNMSMKEVGVDLLRLDPKSPAHLMYFAPTDVAHQALIAAISISVGIDDGHEHPERLLYIPMATTTVKTTLPSKTIHFSNDRNVAERNANILFANLVITSPSVDIDPKHLPILLEMLRNRRANRPQKQSHLPVRHHLLSRLLPKATVKLAIQEPVIRVSLPPLDAEKKSSEEFDMLIHTTSSISLDLDSSHSAGGDLHYSLSSNFRILSHSLYYQTTSGQKHNLLMSDTVELKVQVSASPEVAVIATGNIQTFSVFLVRPEICEGVRLILAQLRKDQLINRHHDSPDRPSNFLRRFPSWLHHFNVQASDFSVEVAGVDAQVSKNARGVALHLESWTAEYKANKNDEREARPARRRASRNIVRDDVSSRASSPATPPSPPTPRKRQ